MAKKVLNERCPLQVECERKTCEYVHKELECPYYSANAREGHYIYDQEEIRDRRDREAMDEALLASLDDDDDDTSDGLVYIPVEQLYPHPDNPRKDLGDLTELADSIKANGILQNLTVVPRFVTGEITGDTWQKGYTVIIGHRRLAASKLAGLKELPCVITEMDHRSQVQTMLMENMQRTDLTVYEQAQGFQMMLDLGDSMEEIAEKSGFSRTTVRKRLEIAKLDSETLQKVSARQLTLGDFDELAKIDDLETRNKLLASMGTANFKSELQIALKNQKLAKRMEEWLAVIRTFAAEDPNANYETKRYVRNYGYYNMDQDVEVPEDAGSRKYFFKKGERQIDLYVERDPTKEQEENAEREERKRKAEEKWQRLQDVNNRHYALRSEFVKDLSNAMCKRSYPIVCGLVANCMYKLGEWNGPEMDLNLLADLLGIVSKDPDLEPENLVGEWAALRGAIEAFPEKTLLCMAYCSLDDEDTGYWRRVWGLEGPEYQHTPNRELDALYAVLVSLGYEMSDEEKEMQNGTHELLTDKEIAV